MMNIFRTKLFAPVVNYSVLLIFSMTSCTTVMNKMYGVQQLNGVNEQEINQFYGEIDFSSIETDKVIIDSVQFKTLREHESDSIKKDLSQPIQIQYFEKGNLISFHANCYAKGSLKNLNWNYQNRFESFIPISAVKDLTPYPVLQRLNRIISDITISSEKEIVIVIFWTRMLEEISKDAINTVITNIREFDKEEEVHLILLNTDSFFSKI